MGSGVSSPPKGRILFFLKECSSQPCDIHFCLGLLSHYQTLSLLIPERLPTMMSIFICSCGDPLSPVDSVTISGVPFHHACLLCVVGSPVFLSFLHRLALFGSQVCNKSLEGKMVTLDSENKPYCTKVRGRDDYFSITTFDNLSLSLGVAGLHKKVQHCLRWLQESNHPKKRRGIF